MSWKTNHPVYAHVHEDMIRHIKYGLLTDRRYSLMTRLGLQLISTDDDTYTDYALLRFAILENQIRVSRYLINYGFRVNSRIKFPFDSPLHEAIRLRDFGIVEMLLEKDASITILNKDKKSPLQLAAEIGDFRILNLIFKYADSYCYRLQKYHQWTSLHVACAKNDMRSVLNIIETKPEIINSIIGSTSPIWQGCTALHIAVTCRHESIIEILLDQNVDICIPDSTGMTVLHLTDKLGLQVIGKMLFESRCMRFNTNPMNELGLTHFHIACKVIGDSPHIIESYLASGLVDINAIIPHEQVYSYSGFTPLHICVRHSYKIGAMILLRNGADLTIKEFRGKTPFRMAIEKNDIKMVEIFLDNRRIFNEDIQEKSYLHEYLHNACQSGTFNIVIDLLEKGVDPNGTSLDGICAGYTVLHFAVKSGTSGMVQYLLDNPRTNVDAINKHKDTPLNIAVRCARADIIQMLLNRGARITNSCFNDALWRRSYAVIHALLVKIKSFCYITPSEESIWSFYQLECLSCTHNVNIAVAHFPIFVDDDPEPNMFNSTKLLKGITLHLAVQKSNFGMMQYLLTCGDISVDVVNSKGETPLHTCVRMEEECIGTLTVLLNHGVNINAQTNNGFTPLHICVRKVVQSSLLVPLLNAGADIDVQTTTGKTALHLAMENNKVEVIKILINHGANLRLQDYEGVSGLHMIASSIKYFDDVKDKIIECLASSASVDIPDIRGSTPLHIAAFNDFQIFAELLMQYGADPNRPDQYKRTPLHMACRKSHLCTIELLLKAGASAVAKDQEGYLPLHFVVQCKRWREYTETNNENKWIQFMKIFQCLLIAGRRDMSIHEEEKLKYTALQTAVFYNNQECILALIYCGAKFDEPSLQDSCQACYRLRNTNPAEELFQRYTIQLDVLGFRTSFKTMNPETWHMDYKSQCLVEVQRMSNDIIVDKLSLREVVCSAPSDIARYSTYPFAMEFIKSDTIYTKYPHMGKLIVSRLLYGQRISQEDIHDAKYILSMAAIEHIGYSLPDYLSEGILRYLTESELHTLAKSLEQT